MSNRLLNKLLKYGTSLRFASLDSKVGDLLLRRMSEEVRCQVVSDTTTEGGDEGRYKSIVVCDANRTYVKSSALLEIMRLLTSASSTEDYINTDSVVKYSKRFKMVQYLTLLSYIFPNKMRDRAYDFVTRRKKLFGSATVKNDANQDARFVNDSILTGRKVEQDISDENKATSNVFQSDNPPTRGSRIQIVYPPKSLSVGPSITYDDEFPNGLCLTGGIGTISTVDLPMRIVLRVERGSLGLDTEADGVKKEGIIAWVKPEEVALI
jgi:predicted DCC family thiol-disulfide oxidoreductase YuxK